MTFWRREQDLQGGRRISYNSDEASSNRRFADECDQRRIGGRSASRREDAFGDAISEKVGLFVSWLGGRRKVQVRKSEGRNRLR